MERYLSQTILSSMIRKDTLEQVKGILLKSVLFYNQKYKEVYNAIVFSPDIVHNPGDKFISDNYRNCVVLLESEWSEESVVNGNLVLHYKNVLNLVNNIISIDYINDPTTLDQNLMRYNKDLAKNSFLERYISHKIPKYGRNVILGDEENILIENESQRIKFQSIGGVTLGSDVVIGNNVIIYRGLTEDTIIDDGVVIPDYVIIHHDAHITKNLILESFKEYY